MGVAVGDYDNSGRFSLFKTNFAEEYNNLYHNDGDHFTDVSFRSKTAASSLPFVGWGDGVLRLRQRRLAGHHRRQRPRLPAAGPGAAGRLRGLPPAEAPVPQPRRRDLRRGGRAVRARCSRSERVSRGLAVGDLDDDGRLDVVINDLDGSPQVLHNELAERGELAAREARRARAEHQRHRRRGHGQGGEAEPDARSCRAGRATSRRTTCAATSAWARRRRRTALEVRWPDGTTSRRWRT